MEKWTLHTKAANKWKCKGEGENEFVDLLTGTLDREGSGMTDCHMLHQWGQQRD